MRLRTAFLGAFSVLALAMVVACGGANPSTNYPSASIGKGQAANGSITLVQTTGLAVGSLSVGGSGSVSARQSTTNPSAVPVLAAKHRENIPTGQTPVAYITITASGNATIDSVDVSVAPLPAPTGGSYSLAYWNGTQWVSFQAGGAVNTATPSSGVITISGVFNPARTLASGSSLYLCVYTGGGSFTTPTPPPPAPVVSPSSITLNLGIPQSVTVTSGEDIAISAKSSNTGVVTVPASETTNSTNGQATFTLTAVSVGTATITFTDPLNQTGTLSVTVVNTNPTPLPSPASGVIGAGDSVTFQIPAKTEITAVSSNTAVLTVTPSASPSGGYATITATAVAPGNATITFSDTTSDTAQFTGEVSAITNGGFTEGTGGLQGWTPCSFAHNPYNAPITATAYDDGTAQTTSTTTVTSGLTSLVSTVTASSVPDSNPTSAPLPSYPPFGTNVALVGSTNSGTTAYPKGAFGMCQQITLPSASTPQYLSFYGWLAGSGYSFKSEDQEADILDSTGTTVESTLFAEQACYENPNGTTPSGTASLAGPIIAPGASTSSSCWGGYSGSYVDWLYGGYWQPFGPYDLSAYAGQTITLFIGNWSVYADNATKYAQLLYVANVETTTGNSVPTAAPLMKRRVLTITLPTRHQVTVQAVKPRIR